MAKKILLVEDEVFIQQLYERVLSQAGFTVLTASDGLAGLELVKKETNSNQKPDLVLLDIMMPKMNGIDVLKQLKKDGATKSIPIILLTNLGEENIIKQAFAEGVQGYLVKSRLTPYEVVKQVEEFLENPQTPLNPENINLG